MTDGQELITVGIACYNIEHYAARCIASVREQTCPHLEILIVDDGSTDATPQVIRKAAGDDPRIRILRQENRGLGGARNTILREAKGDYLLFVDGDDYLSPVMIELLYGLLKAERADLAVCGYLQEEDEASGRGQRRLPDHFPEDVRTRVPVRTLTGAKALTALIEEDEETVIQNAAWNKLYRRSLAQGLTFPERKKYEDIVYTTRLVARAERVAVTPLPLYHYITARSGSIMAGGVRQEILTDQIPAYAAQRKVLTEAGRDDLVASERYLVCKKLLLLYTEARRSRDPAKRACREGLAREIRAMRPYEKEMAHCRIANPREILRARLFWIHPVCYHLFMEINEGVVLPLRRRFHRERS